MKQLLTICILLLTAFMPAYGQNGNGTSQSPNMITVDANDLDPATLATLKAKEAEQKMKEKIDTYGKWVGIGKEVGVAVDEGLTAVTKHSTAIADTRIGKVTMFIIAYKVIGKDIIRIALGLTIWFILTIMFTVSFF